MTARVILVVLLASGLLVLLSGCAGRRNEIVGTWDGTMPEQKSEGTIGEVIEKSILGLAGKSSKIEFNNKGRYKLSFAELISVEGSWTLNGDLVELQPDKDGSEQRGKLEPAKLMLSKDGATLSSPKEFESDPVFVFKKRVAGAANPRSMP